MVKVQNKWINRVITIRIDNTNQLDKWESELLDIIDSFGGTNPYPRLVSGEDGELIAQCTTKIGRENIEEFDKEITEWHNKP